MATRILRTFLAAILLISLGTSAIARSNPNSALKRSVKEFKLANGMRWLLVERHQAPVFSGVVMIRVGGTDEMSGKAGLAHMLEHMAFKGTKVIGTSDWNKEEPILKKLSEVGKELSLEKSSPSPNKEKISHLQSELKRLTAEHEKYYLKNEVWEIMNRNGAMDLNAFTSKDVTAYHASMPINRLELWAAILSQIITEPVFREFYTEREVVAEERRSGIDNNPDGKMVEKLLDTAFQEGPYQWPTAGPEKDIQGYLQEDAKAFQEKHYVPSLMVGVLVGDIEIDSAKKVIGKYFGKIPSRDAPPQSAVPVNEGGGTVSFEFDAQPSMLMAFHKPTLPDPEEYIFDVVTTLLCDGPTSRLYRKLVIEKRMATRVSCSDAYPGSRLPNLFLIWVEPMGGASLKRIGKLIEEELDRLKKEFVNEQELERVRTKVAASFIFGLETNVDLAMGLARFETIFNDWRLLATYPDHVAKVTKEDVMELAKRYLTESNRTVVERLQKNRD